MQNAQNIYRENVVRLPNNEKLRLATLILQDLSDVSDSGNKKSALELLESLPAQRVFNSAAEVDSHLETERESWDN
ncbi:MAG: hypothetical protein LH472_10035 [Pyrinomonadaceae bacterium]|nr:hypothetical protein [Pyrinomonadaceae bacterium]